MASRILAVIAALGMIAGAYVYRYGTPGEDGDGGGGGGRGATAGVVICAAELGSVCEALPGSTVEPAGETARRLISARSASAAGVSGWVVPGPWPAMVDEGRRLASRAPLFDDDREVLASTQLVAVARKGQLPSTCPVTWRCLGDAAQDPGFRLGGESPSTSIGLFVRAAALGGYFDTTDYATNDLQDTPDAQTWLDNLDNRIRSARGFGAGTLESFVLQRGSARVFLTSGAAARSLEANPDFDVVTPAMATRLVVTFTPTAGRGATIDADAVERRLLATGYQQAGPAQVDEGLPSAGVLLALSEVG